MSAIFKHHLVVLPDAVDTNGHANNVEYVRWMQDAAVHHSESTGGTPATRAAGATWVVRGHRIEYLRPAFGGDNVVVLTWVSTLRRVRSLRRYLMVRQRDGAVLARGETDWVFVDQGSGRPRSIPPEVSKRYVLVPEQEEPTGL